MKNLNDGTNGMMLKDTKSFNIDMPQGYYLSWFCTTQAAFKVTVTLRDENKIYFSESKQSTPINPPLSMGADSFVGRQLSLEIYIPASSKIKIQANTNIVTVEGNEVARCFTWLAEDSNDNDYNDMHLSLIGWKYKG